MQGVLTCGQPQGLLTVALRAITQLHSCLVIDAAWWSVRQLPKLSPKPGMHTVWTGELLLIADESIDPKRLYGWHSTR